MSMMQLDDDDVEDSVLFAKETAMQKVAKLLPLPDSLASLKKIRDDYASRLQRNDALLTSSVMNQVEYTKAGMEAISQAQLTVSQLRQNFLLINRLCDECRTVIEHHDQINLLSHARNNLNKTYTDVQGMMSISTLAADARESLKDEKQLLQTLEALTALEQKRRFAMATVSTRVEEASRLTAFFDEVRETRTLFEQTLWNHISNFFELAKTSPQTLVRAICVVEMQEIADQLQTEEEQATDNVSSTDSSPKAGEGELPIPSVLATRSSFERESLRRSISLPSRVVADQARRAGFSAEIPTLRRGYKDQCYGEIQNAIEKRFTKLLDELVAGDLQTALEQATLVANELADNFDYVAPCFPPRYEIFQVIVQCYTERFVQMLHKLSARASDLTNQEILMITEWVVRYQEKLLSLGVEEMLASVCAESGAMDPLFQTYISRMKITMQRMFTNIMDADKVNPPKRTESGRVWTPAGVDLFRLLNEQLKVVQSSSTDLMLFHVAVAINQLMQEFQKSEKERLEQPPLLIGLEMLCAMVNNNVKCHEMTNDMSTSILEDMPLSYVEQVSFDDVSQEFLAVAKCAVQQSVKAIFEDPGVKELLAKLYQKDWLDCLVTEYLIPTFEDYFEDIESYLEETYFNKFVEFCIEETVVIYIDRLLLQKIYMKEEMLERMKRDRELLQLYFKEIVSSSKVEKRLQPLSDIWEVASSESVDAYTLAYTNLLQNHPDCPPEVVEKLISMRIGIPWKDAREIVAGCKELYNASLHNGLPPKPGPVFSKVTILTKKK